MGNVSRVTPPPPPLSDQVFNSNASFPFPFPSLFPLSLRYTEYFQWSPEHNSNSPQHGTKAGNVLVGTLEYDSKSDSYDLTQRDTTSGTVSKQNVACQKGKRYTVPYVVYEKVWSCGAYPPDGKVTFSNITAECDGEDCTKSIKWSAKVKDANCDMKAHITSPEEISITWDTKAKSVHDGKSMEEMIEMNRGRWATSEVVNRARIVNARAKAHLN